LPGQQRGPCGQADEDADYRRAIAEHGMDMDWQGGKRDADSGVAQEDNQREGKQHLRQAAWRHQLGIGYHRRLTHFT